MINPGKTQEQKWQSEKQDCLIRYYVRNPHLGKAKLKKMDNQIKRNKDGKVAPRSMAEFEQMEKFRSALNAERERLKK